MIWLLTQIGVCLALAALAGWYLGWSWRGFRDRDRIEDIRRVLHATEDVKERELTEAYRRIETLEAERAASRRVPLSSVSPAITSAADGAQRPDAIAQEAPGLAGGASASVAVAEAPPDLPRPDPSPTTLSPTQAADQQLDQPETDVRSQQLQQALQAKTAAVLSMQAEIASLRSSLREKAEELARLEARVIELEPLEREVAERDRQLQERAAAEQRRTEGIDEEQRRLQEYEARLNTLNEQLQERDRQINQLRSRTNDAISTAQQAEAEAARRRHELQECSRMLAQLESRVQEGRRKLQLQIQRNRKQEIVHRSVVADLQHQLSRLQQQRAASDPAVDAPAEADAAAAKLVAELDRRRRQVAERDRELSVLRGNLAQLEQLRADLAERERQITALRAEIDGLRRERTQDRVRYRQLREQLQHPDVPAADDLKAIHGIGPKLERTLNELGIVRFEQIAAWSEEDVERIAARIGAFPDRIRRDAWIEGARRQYLLKYGRPFDTSAREGSGNGSGRSAQEAANPDEIGGQN